MNERYRRLKAAVQAGEGLTGEARDAALRDACGGDADLLAEARELLGLDTTTTLPELSFFRPDPERLAEGTRLGRYDVVAFLGAGGMGEIYEGERAEGDYTHRVAIKVMGVKGLHSGELRRRFESERQLVADLGQHPNVPGLLDGGETPDGRPYMVMDKIAGEPVDVHCRRHALSVRQRLRLFLKVCDAVRHAHRHLVIHRDLKPGNILVTSDGEPQLLDFGIAKDLGDAGRTPETRLGTPATPDYASPEQLSGGRVTTASDVYSLGVVLYELLTDGHPFRPGAGDGARDSDPLAGRSESSPPSRPSVHPGAPRTLRRTLRGDLDHVVLTALAPNPAKRYDSVGALQRDLRRYLDGRPLASRGGLAYRASKLLVRRWPALVAAAVLAAAAVFLVTQELERRQLERASGELNRFLVGIFGDDLDGEANAEDVLDGILQRGADVLDGEGLADQPAMRAVFLGAIGQRYRQKRDYEKAAPYLRECLALRRAHLPPDHPLVGKAANNLGNVLRGLGQYAEARDLLDEARRVWTIEHPGDHPETAAILSNLAGVEKELGHADTAVRLYRDALAMKERLAAESAETQVSPHDVARARRNLATGLRAAGRRGPTMQDPAFLDEAEDVLHQALDAFERPADRAVVTTMLAGLCNDRGDPAAARRWLEQSLAVQRQLDDGHPALQATLWELAAADRAAGRLDAAEDGLRRILDARRKALGDLHPLVGRTWVALGEVLVERGDPARARAVLDQGLKILRARLPPEHWRIVEAQALADALGVAAGSRVPPSAAPEP